VVTTKYMVTLAALEVSSYCFTSYTRRVN